jgi:uncharacterized protein
MLAIGLAAGAAAVAPQHGTGALWFVAANFIEVAPYMVAGVLITALVVGTGATGFIARSFSGRQPLMIVVAAALGALTPVCGITVLPLIAGLLAAGVPLAPIMAFWLSSPVTDPSMLAVTAGLLGWPFAVAKTTAAFAIGAVAGATMLALHRLPVFARPLCNTPGSVPAPDCGPEGFKAAFWRDPTRLATFLAAGRETGLLMVKWLTVAFVAEYGLRQVLPPETIAGAIGGDGVAAVALATLVGAPIYLDGYAALPLVRALLDAGMGPGAALAFLIAGGITSAWAAIPVYALTRLPVFVAYLVMAVTGAFVSGIFFSWIMA